LTGVPAEVIISRVIEPARQDQSAALKAIADFEATVQRGILSSVLRSVGRTAAFASFYRRVGPSFDAWMMRRSWGWVLGRLYGLPSLLLTTTGAKTGLARSSPLLYVRDGDAFLVVGTNFGQAHHPAWTGNLLAHPSASARIGPGEVSVVAELLDEPRFAAQWPKFVEVYPGYAGYVRRSGRAPRMFRLTVV
jgi:deazaflavin-dependent oxidoreductase (nitroreductase family)